MRLNDRGRLDLGAEKKIVDAASMRYRARKRWKWRTAVHSGYVRTREGDQHEDRGEEKKRADPWASQGAGGGAVNVRGFQPGGAWIGVKSKQKDGETGRDNNSDLISETTKLRNKALCVRSFSSPS